MSFSGMLPLPFATVDIAPVGEQLIAVGGLVAAGLGALWAAWTRPSAQPVPIPVRGGSSRRNPRR
ncbi:MULTISPECIES: hypothetical protein [Myxococcus]|uniref:Uncharacterized protein n=1 Tax=Myxococcus virescens TaxID=83456 RepID=A0A511HFW5_9BACT|nr:MULTISPECIES: hypothetical protein [Myxococcus]WNZ62257.1 hypothetical protein QEG98_41775 [Myxococcus sp. MxC21-1]GEL72447.1 hypothetical protein MVI01_42310 [Myxococcus virescens]SDE39222.1 hypothetical protein SAMN04488504_106318 [Myxococcus virescens]